MSRNARQITIMGIAAVIGGIIGAVVGLFVLNPGILIPIGVVVGVSAGLPIAQKKV